MTNILWLDGEWFNMGITSDVEAMENAQNGRTGTLLDSATNHDLTVIHNTWVWNKIHRIVSGVPFYSPCSVIRLELGELCDCNDFKLRIVHKNVKLSAVQIDVNILWDCSVIDLAVDQNAPKVVGDQQWQNQQWAQTSKNSERKDLICLLYFSNFWRL